MIVRSRQDQITQQRMGRGTHVWFLGQQPAQVAEDTRACLLVVKREHGSALRGRGDRHA